MPWRMPSRASRVSASWKKRAGIAAGPRTEPPVSVEVVRHADAQVAQGEVAVGIEAAQERAVVEHAREFPGERERDARVELDAVGVIEAEVTDRAHEPELAALRVHAAMD